MEYVLDGVQVEPGSLLVSQRLKVFEIFGLTNFAFVAQDGPRLPVGGAGVCWVPATSGQVPPSSIQAGQDNGEPLYVARAQHEGALIPGKLVSSHGCAYIAWGGAEHPKKEYEVS